MGHYEVLGVAPEASVAEIRRSYLARARQSHPDVHGHDPATKATAERRMRDLNAAWAVLSDPDERSSYDRERIKPDSERTRRPPFHASTVAHEAFHPFDDRPDPEFDEDHDRPITASRLPAWLVMAPPMLVVAGLGGLVLGSIVNITLLVDAGLMMMLGGGVLFLVAPLVALGSSRRGDASP